MKEQRKKIKGQKHTNAGKRTFFTGLLTFLPHNLCAQGKFTKHFQKIGPRIKINGPTRHEKPGIKHRHWFANFSALQDLLPLWIVLLFHLCYPSYCISLAFQLILIMLFCSFLQFFSFPFSRLFFYLQMEFFTDNYFIPDLAQAAFVSFSDLRGRILCSKDCLKSLPTMKILQ